MLLFAIFTLGYFFGVVITLKVFGQKDKVKGYRPAKSSLNKELTGSLSSWEIFTQLTKINYPKGLTGSSLDKQQQKTFANSIAAKTRLKQAYTTS